MHEGSSKTKCSVETDLPRWILSTGVAAENSMVVCKAGSERELESARR